MDHLERVLDERAGDLLVGLAAVGFSHDEARRFLTGVGPELVQSYEWHAASLDGSAEATPEAASEVLAGIRGRALALQIGLSTEKTWAGLRELVPAVLEASKFARPSPGSASQRGSNKRPPRGTEIARFDVGFGLTLERLRSTGSDSREPVGWIGVKHPIFGGLLSPQD